MRKDLSVDMKLTTLPSLPNRLLQASSVSTSQKMAFQDGQQNHPEFYMDLEDADFGSLTCATSTLPDEQS